MEQFGDNYWFSMLTYLADLCRKQIKEKCTKPFALVYFKFDSLMEDYNFQINLEIGLGKLSNLLINLLILLELHVA